MKTPIIYSKTAGGENAPVFAQGDYDVFVGALKEDLLPLYVVINRTSGVVELTTEVTGHYKDWLNHFAPVDNGQVPLELQGGLNMARN